jgi:8-oxo-dGTP pyrophosphatase MutT (NUDIX family)
MPHIFHALDYTVAIFVVHRGRILLVHHRKLGKWLPLGGHIELGEDPEQAALRETREESGLEVELLGERPPTDGDGTRALVAPRFVDVHRISDTHEHVGLIYWARPRDPDAEPVLSAEHHALRWFLPEELPLLQPPLSRAVHWYCSAALREITALR